MQQIRIFMTNPGPDPGCERSRHVASQLRPTGAAPRELDQTSCQVECCIAGAPAPLYGIRVPRRIPALADQSAAYHSDGWERSPSFRTATLTDMPR
jgi:hypothetical protein